MNLLSTSTGRKVLFGFLYLSEGAPIGFIWWALPTKLRVAGVSVEEITTLTSLLVLPWVFKFLWAPLVDTIRSPRWTLRSWIIAAQMFMGVSLLPLIFLDLRQDFALVFPLLLIHAFAAATQDVSIDALSISTAPSTERGAINGWMQAGMLAGRSLCGGGALLLAATVGDHIQIMLLIAVIGVSMILVMMSKAELTVETPTLNVTERWRDFAERFGKTMKQTSTWIGLLFAGISAAGFEAIGAVAGPFMIDRGLSTENVGAFFAGAVVAGMVGGALLGGYISDRIGRKRSVAIFLLLFVSTIIALALLDQMAGGESQMWTVVLLSILYFCIGMFTASSYALFMDITDPRLGATQFSAYMGATNGCEAWAGYTVGKLHTALGFPIAFIIMSVVSLISLPLLSFISVSADVEKRTQTSSRDS